MVHSIQKYIPTPQRKKHQLKFLIHSSHISVSKDQKSKTSSLSLSDPWFSVLNMVAYQGRVSVGTRHHPSVSREAQPSRPIALPQHSKATNIQVSLWPCFSVTRSVLSQDMKIKPRKRHCWECRFECFAKLVSMNILENIMHLKYLLLQNEYACSFVEWYYHMSATFANECAIIDHPLCLETMCFY